MKNEKFPAFDIRTNKIVYFTDEEFNEIIDKGEAIYYDDPYVRENNSIDWFSDDYVIYEDEEEKTPQDYEYILRHGVGPGTLPKDVSVLDWEDLPNWKTAVWIDRPLTSEEMEEYEVMYPNELR